MGLTMGAASSGTMFAPGEWYRRLIKPGWTPKDYVFPLVWTPLYLMIAVSGWLAWNAAPAADLFWPMALFAAQLLLNFGWSAVFFGLKQVGWGLVEVAALWLSIAMTILAFLSLSTWAAMLLVPYLIWVSIAAYLNYSIWRLNRSQPVEA